MASVKTPLRRQLEARECGAVALGIILQYFGKHVALDDLRAACGVTRDGVRVSSLVKAAHSYSLKARALKRNSLIGIEPPFIIFWNFNHFLVVEEVSETCIRVNDPAQGRIYLTNALIHRHYSGILLTFELTDDFVSTPSIHSASRWSRESIAYVAVEVSRVIPESIFALGFAQGRWIEMAGLLTLLWIVYTLLHLCTVLKMEHLYDTASLFRHLLYAPLGFFRGHYVASLAHRLSYTDDIATHHVTALLPVTGLLRGLCYAAVLLWIHPLTAVMSCSWGCLNAMIGLWADDRERLYEAEQKIFTTRFQSVTFNGFGNIETLKLQGRETEFLNSFKQAQAEALSLPFAPWRVVNKSMPLFNLGVLLIMTLGLIENRLLTIPQGIASFILSLLMMESIRIATNWLRAREEFLHVLDQWHDLKSTKHELSIPHAERAGVALVSVTFGYGDTAVVDGIDLDLTPGKRLGLVGRSGSGKSTIVGLVTGLYRPWTGEVEVGKGRIALVDSQSFLVDGTLAENLTCFDASIPHDRIRQGAKDALLHDLITALPEEYQCLITPENHPFSWGALQRLEIARALTTDPGLLLLDEATNALDAVTERNILDNIAARGCGCLIVSHRLSAVRGCDEIIVLEKGRIVQRGTHAELLQQQGAYQKLIAEGEIR